MSSITLNDFENNKNKLILLFDSLPTNQTDPNCIQEKINLLHHQFVARFHKGGKNNAKNVLKKYTAFVQLLEDIKNQKVQMDTAIDQINQLQEINDWKLIGSTAFHLASFVLWTAIAISCVALMLSVGVPLITSQPILGSLFILSCILVSLFAIDEIFENIGHLFPSDEEIKTNDLHFTKAKKELIYSTQSFFSPSADETQVIHASKITLD